MPERDRLADSLFRIGSLRNTEGIDLMNDLVALFSSRTSETYCVELNSSRSHCDTCGVSHSAKISQEWWRHVYHCRKERFEGLGGFTDFCFLCFAWLDHVDAWIEHAKYHSSNVPLKCNMAMFRGTVLRPAWCPDCMSQMGNLGFDGKGITQFFNVTAWKTHMETHVQRLRPGPHKCSHPRCQQQPACASVADYIAHRFDIHLIPAPDSAVVDIFRRSKMNCKSTAADKAFGAAKGFEQAGKTLSPRLYELHSADSNQVTTPADPEASSLSKGVASLIFVARGNVSTGIGEDEASPVPDMPTVTGYDQAQQYYAGQSPETLNELSLSTSTSSSSPDGQSRWSESPTKRRQRSRSCFGSTPPNGIGPGPTTIEVVIPAKPLGWENVPLVNSNGCIDESTGVHAVCDEDAPEYSSSLAEVGHAALLSAPTRPSRKSLMHSNESRITAARGARKGTVECAKISEYSIQRRHAITEMHARIRDRRQSRLRIAATASV